MRTRKTGPDDIPALKALWKQAFGDTDAEIDSFFKTVYPEATGFCAEEDGAVIAMLFALPLTLAHGEETQKAAYLYAVATDEAFRGRGVSTDIIEGSILSTLDAVNKMLDGPATALSAGAASKAQHSFDEADMLSGHTDK